MPAAGLAGAAASFSSGLSATTASVVNRRAETEAAFCRADRVTLEDGEIRTYSFYDTRTLFDWGFDNFSYQTVLTSDEVVKEAEVSLSREVSYVTVHPAEDVELLLPNGVTADQLERTISIETPVEAPIAEGESLGTLQLSYDGQVYATVDLLALNDVEASKLLVLGRNIQLFFEKTVVRVIAIILLILVVVLIVWKLTLGRRRYRYGRSVNRRGRGGGYRGRRRR